jgi:hypothetical protein
MNLEQSAASNLRLFLERLQLLVNRRSFAGIPRLRPASGGGSRLRGRDLSKAGGVGGSLPKQPVSQGNRQMRRVLNQVANAAVKTNGSVFQAVYRRLLPRIGHCKAIWAVANRLCRLTWKILHKGVSFEEREFRLDPRATRKRAVRLL